MAACILGMVAGKLRRHHVVSFRSLRMTGLPLKPGDTGPMVTQMQNAIIKNGLSVGPAGANGTFNSDTGTELEEFQDNAALPVKPECDQQCWTALGLPGP